jgi:hypothetical protein
VPRRVRVKARADLLFRAQMGWYPQDREIAMKVLDNLLVKAKSLMAGRALCIWSIRTDLPVNATRDTSDGAFVRLAPSTVYQLSGDAQVPDRTESLLAFFQPRPAIVCWRLH